jgi:ABC-2 type transport system permease protein
VHAFTTLARVELALLLREPAAVGFTLVLPLLLLALNGGDNAANPDFGGAGLVDVLIPGLIVYVIATSAVMTLPETLAGYRERGILRRLRISPLRPWQILGAHATVHAAMAVAGLGLLLTAGFAAFDLRLPASAPAVALAVVLSVAAIIALGFLLAAVAPTARTTQAVAAAIYFPAIFVSGAVIPREALPDVARRVGDALPFTYAVDAIRSAWSGGTVDLAALAVLAATAVVAAAVALRAFRWEARS